MDVQERIMRRPEVEGRTGIPCSTLYAKMSAGEFPKPVPLGKKSVGWLETEVAGWIEERKKARK